MDSTEKTIGRCHLCQDRKEIVYCSACQHFFCAECRERWWERGLEFVKRLVGGKIEGCCGPREVANASGQR